MYILHYFPLGGRGELSRLLMEELQIPYKENILSFQQLAEQRDQYPWGQLPVLREEGTDFELSQSLAIARFLSKEKGTLYPSNDTRRAAKVESIADGIADYRAKAYGAFFKPDAAEKQKATKHFRDVELKHVLVKLEKWLEKNGGEFIVGNELSLADFAVYDFVEEMFSLINFADDIPNLVKHRERIASRPNISAYIQSGRRKQNIGQLQKIEE